MEKNRICPLMDGERISEDECFECCLVTERYLVPDILPQKARDKDDFREICISCKYHDLS